ncbi:MAG: SRPBCC family protein [Acidimicrobiia bacterium]|nr:SRPBCC family protein [Acidimicrobiia bacterium]MYC57055.1 SRPBCC family protein [Acidimicrobiia bacterium]MYG93662.1 SRPBCC family protein [Acidimicrobiia bacterium]MYI30132.1 SRPBCC family protein [Acidimicrobiia bacterium]
MHTVSSSTPIAAPQQLVWEVIANHDFYAHWAISSQVTLDVKGTPDPNGVGDVRVSRFGPVSIREEITMFEPPNRMAYRVVSSPLPLRSCCSEFLLVTDQSNNGCTLHCDIWFELMIPLTGPIMRRLMNIYAQRIVAGIAGEAVRQAA